MNVRKTLARLNAKSQSFTSSGGGTPEITSADIAAALAMVRDSFARDVLCAIWWPEGASQIRDSILMALAQKQREEIERQSREVYVSRLELHLASDTEDTNSLAQMSAKVQKIESQMWDTRALVYMRSIGAAVFNEMSRPNTCRACDGVGYAIGKDRVHICAKCEGAGIISLKLIDRARMVGVSEKQYVRHGIRKVYEWTYSLVRDAEQAGARALGRKLK